MPPAAEPRFELVHSEVASGKSTVIARLRELFVDVQGWQHGIQFVCLAFRKTQAAQIDGYTIHRWANIPTNYLFATNMRSRVDYQEFCVRCQSLRWMIIDEIEMVPAGLFRELQKRLADGVLDTSAYKRRSDNSPRPFAGVNVLLRCAEWPGEPVANTSLFTRPARKGILLADENYRHTHSRDCNVVQRVTQLTTYPAADTWSVQRLLRLAVAKECSATCPMNSMAAYPQFAEAVTAFLRWRPRVEEGALTHVIEHGRVCPRGAALVGGQLPLWMMTTDKAKPSEER